MSDQNSVVSLQRRGKRRVNLFRAKRAQTMINLGCLPAVIIVMLMLLAVVNLMVFAKAPTWVTDKQSYLAAGRLILSVGTLAGVQLLATWATGLGGALFGVRAARGQGRLLPMRLEVIRRRLAISAWAVVVIRLLMIGVVIVGIVNLYTLLFGFRLRWDFADDVRRIYTSYWILFWGMVLVLLAQWLVGPLLRLRHSLALGALAGSLTRNRDYRPWLALTLRLGSGLAGMVAVIWGISILWLLLRVVYHAGGYQGVAAYPDLFPRIPSGPARAATAMLLLTVILTIHTAVQIVSTQVALAVARARLARPVLRGYYATASASFREFSKASARPAVN